MEIATKQKTVLIVEDDVALNRAATFKFKQQGNRVISTMRAEDALEVLKSEHSVIDVVWLDFLLPDMNGAEFLSEVSKHKEYKGLKIVICSVSGRGELKEVLRKQGVVDYLIKSDYDLNTIVDKVLAHA